MAAGPSLVVVGNSFLRYDVPRARVASIGSPDHYDLKLTLDDGSAIPLRVFEPALRRSVRGSARHGTGRARIQEALGDKPAPASDAGVVRRRVRWGSVAVLALPFASAAAIIVTARR